MLYYILGTCLFIVHVLSFCREACLCEVSLLSPEFHRFLSFIDFLFLLCVHVPSLCRRSFFGQVIYPGMIRIRKAGAMLPSIYLKLQTASFSKIFQTACRRINTGQPDFCINKQVRKRLNCLYVTYYRFSKCSFIFCCNISSKC